VLTSAHRILTDSGGPGEFRGGCGLEKGGTLTDCDNTVMSYCCDRSRSITWGINVGLPSTPHGVWVNKGTPGERYLGTAFSNVPMHPGDTFTRPSAGGGGYGDPLLRLPEAVLQDVIDGYVSIEGAARDYGVVVTVNDAQVDDYEVHLAGTKLLRDDIRAKRLGWLSDDPVDVARRYREGELNMYDLIRRYGVIVDWGTGELYEKTTKQFRELMHKRAAAHWTRVAPLAEAVLG
jgi:N-methylhydantoinase B